MLSETLTHDKECNIYLVCICDCYVAEVAKLERCAAAAQEVAKRLEMIQLNGPFGAVPGWTLDLIEALKELES